MIDLSAFVEKAKGSDYFSGWHLADDLERFLAASADTCRALADRSGDVEHVFLVGSGGSLANMQTTKYVFDRLLDVPVDAVPSYELVWRGSPRLGPGSVAFFASWSGETEDTLAALRHARERGAHTVGIVRYGDTAIAREADTAIAYESPALYELPIAALLLFGARLARNGAAAEEAAAIERSLLGLPAVIGAAVREEEEQAEARAREFLDSRHMYVLGAGPLSSLAYKVALTVVMENMRIGGTYCDASEFRHGPAEALERTRPDMMFLVGTDESRAVTLRALEFCRRNGARPLVYDAAELGDVHPLLTPLVLNSLTQWFVVWSALLRGILDLDDRVFMGRQVLAEGGARWP